MNQLDYTDKMDLVTRQLGNGGVFLNTGSLDAPNTMTIGWGSVGVYWGKPVFVVMVRYSRHSFKAINEMKNFTVSIPLHDMKKELGYCGTRTGREGNKFAACGLTAEVAQSVTAPIVGECELHYECKVIAKQSMEPTLVCPDILQRYYGEGDFHTYFYGEIVNCYEK